MPATSEYIPNLDDPSWIAASQALLAQLGVPRRVYWIKNWVQANKTVSGDFLNTVAWLSVNGLITPCYDDRGFAHWVTINNVPHGWLTYKVAPEVNSSRKKRRKKDVEVALLSENLESPVILTEIAQEA